eukprot:SAG11_NODE_9292_length_925_cov_1.085956_1_plen_49_part_00
MSKFSIKLHVVGTSTLAGTGFISPLARILSELSFQFSTAVRQFSTDRS